MSGDRRDERAHPRLDDPAELARLSSTELLVRVRPLLAKAGLTSPRERFRRVEPNVPSVCAELAAEWQRSPLLSGRRVSFGEYLAARLAARLRALDREQHPELSDPHRRYLPQRAPLPLPPQAFVGDAVDGETALATEAASRDAGEEPLAGEGELSSGLDELEQLPPAPAPEGVWREPAFEGQLPVEEEEPRSWREELARTMSSERIAAASQAGVLEALAAFERGEVRSPYRFALRLGCSSWEARCRPATGAFLAAEAVICYWSFAGVAATGVASWGAPAR